MPENVNHPPSAAADDGSPPPAGSTVTTAVEETSSATTVVAPAQIAVDVIEAEADGAPEVTDAPDEDVDEPGVSESEEASESEPESTEDEPTDAATPADDVDTGSSLETMAAEAAMVDAAEVDAAEGTDDEVVIVVFEQTDEADDVDHLVAPADATAVASGGSDLQARWLAAQATFFDDPSAAVDLAHDLVAEAASARAAAVQQDLGALSAQRNGEDADTESRRQLMRGYRELFDRLA